MTGAAIHLRGALPAEAAALTELALRSKACWGYPPAFMAACRAELAVDPASMNRDGCRYTVAELDDAVVGFYGVRRLSPGRFELEALFVEPPHIGRGVGRALIRHAIEAVAAQGGQALEIQGDPHAERFYRAAGGVPSGARESGSVPGRYLPLFTIPIGAAGK